MVLKPYVYKEPNYRTVQRQHFQGSRIYIIYIAQINILWIIFLRIITLQTTGSIDESFIIYSPERTPPPVMYRTLASKSGGGLNS